MEFDYKCEQFLRSLEKLINEYKLPLTTLKYLLFDVANQVDVQTQQSITQYKRKLQQEQKQKEQNEQ